MGNDINDRLEAEVSKEFKNLINVLEEELSKLPKKEEKTNIES